MTYRTLKRQFDLDDAALEDLKEELLFAHPQIADEEGRGLVWTPAPAPSALAVETRQEPPLRSSIPPHLAEKILTSRSALEGERKHVTVLFADLKGSLGHCQVNGENGTTGWLSGTLRSFRGHF